MNQVIIGVGSNIEPRKNITKAKAILARDFGLVAESIFVRTKPVGYTRQADFLNGAVLIHTDWTQGRLRQHLKTIEGVLGRPRQQQDRRRILRRFGPRTLDLDIVVWNGKVVDRDFYERDYLKMAVLELEPGLHY